MAWTTPRTWQVDELVTATIMNTHIRDNLNALKVPASSQVIRDNGARYQTTATSFTAIDSTNMIRTLNTAGGDILVWFWGTFVISATNVLCLDIRYDTTTRVGAAWTQGLLATQISNVPQTVHLGPIIISGLSAGSHTFDVMWKTSGGTMQLAADSGDATATYQVPPVLIAREMS